ncbi:phasin family protein, partial [Lysobacter sp. D1-1-M9]
MYQQFNEQFAAATRQFADTAAQVNRIALENAQAVFGLQMAAMEDRATATFAFLGEATNVRDAEGMKDLLPKGVQVVRENAERGLATSQEVIGRTVKTTEQIAQIAKTQVEAAADTTRANVEQATKAATDKAESYTRGST